MNLSSNIMQKSLKIKQDDSVRAYWEEFEHLLIYLPPIADTIMEQTFFEATSA